MFIAAQRPTCLVYRPVGTLYDSQGYLPYTQMPLGAAHGFNFQQNPPTQLACIANGDFPIVPARDQLPSFARVASAFVPHPLGLVYQGTMVNSPSEPEAMQPVPLKRSDTHIERATGNDFLSVALRKGAFNVLSGKATHGPTLPSVAF